MGGLKCTDLGGTKTCTVGCGSSDDCAKNNALGTNFGCTNFPLLNDPATKIAICAPRTQSGCPTSSPDLCLSKQFDRAGVNCASPSGWACNADAQCVSGVCKILQDTKPPFGRCQ